MVSRLCLAPPDNGWWPFGPCLQWWWRYFNFLDVYIFVTYNLPFSRLLLRPLYNFFNMSKVVTLVLHMLYQYVSQLSSSKVCTSKKKNQVFNVDSLISSHVTIRIISRIPPGFNKTIIMSTTHLLKRHYSNFSTPTGIIWSGIRIPTRSEERRVGKECLE